MGKKGSLLIILFFLITWNLTLYICINDKQQLTFSYRTHPESTVLNNHHYQRFLTCNCFIMFTLLLGFLLSLLYFSSNEQANSTINSS